MLLAAQKTRKKSNLTWRRKQLIGKSYIMLLWREIALHAEVQFRKDQQSLEL